MNIKHISLAFAAVAALVTGCSKNSIEGSGEIVEPSNSGNLTDLEITSVNATGTKAVIDGTDFPEEGEIGLFLFRDEMATQDYGDGYKNVKYAYNSDKKKWTASPSIKVGSTPGYLYGYYPYDSESTNIKAVPVKSSLNGDDVMYASKQAEPITDATAANTAITMNHALARVSITVVNKGYTGNAKLSQIKFEGAKIAASGTLDATSGSITATKADNVTLSVPEAAQTITKEGTVYECLLVPSGVETNKQTVTLTLTIDGKDKTATLSGENGVIIAQGTKSNITITLSNKGITVQTVSVEGWNVVEVGGHKVTVKRSSEDGIADDVFLDVTSNGSNVTIKSLSALTGRRTSCTCTPDGKAACTPSIDATTGICTFTITDVQDDITAEVGYLKYNASVAYESDKGAVKLNGTAVASGTPVQILYGEKAVFTAEANTGYSFLKWTDGNDNDLSTDNPYTVSSVTSDITLKAIFEERYAPTLTVTSDSNGKVWIGDDKNKTTGQFEQGEQVVIHAAPNDNFRLFKWNDNNEELDRTITIGATDVTYSAKFISADMIPGLFTIDANKKQVFFSKGNLYYNGNTFNFEDNQYDTTPSSDRARVDNHISHFMWCDNATDAMALKYDSKWDGENKSFFAAKNFTVNGYSGWSVLTGGEGGEWDYLLNSRKTTYGSGELSTENRRYAVVKVNGMEGLLIFPDDFSWPDEKISEPTIFNANENNCNDRNYTVAEFTVLQNNGCVFLPDAGYRDGSTEDTYVFSSGNVGNYWSASPCNGINAYYLYFFSLNSFNVALNNDCGRYMALSVRLVSDVK